MLTESEALMLSGQLAAAAETLQAGTKGTAASAAVDDWARAAKARALAEQTSAMLQAHAASLASSLS